MAQCKACGARILWGVLKNSTTKVPLDLSVPVYTVVGRLSIEDATAVTRLRGTYASHFSICPKASEMSKKGKP